MANNLSKFRGNKTEATEDKPQVKLFGSKNVNNIANFDSIAAKLYKPLVLNGDDKPYEFLLKNSAELERLYSFSLDMESCRQDLSSINERQSQELEQIEHTRAKNVEDLKVKVRNTDAQNQQKFDQQYKEIMSRYNIEQIGLEIDRRYDEDMRDYTKQKTEVLDKMSKAVSFVRNTLSEFKITSDMYDGYLTDDDANQVEVNDLVDIVKTCANTIIALEEDDFSVIQKIKDMDANKTRATAGLMVAATVLAPVLTGGFIFKFGKDSYNLKQKNKQIAELQKEMAKSYKLLKMKSRTLMNTIEEMKPDKKLYDDEVKDATQRASTKCNEEIEELERSKQEADKLASMTKEGISQEIRNIDEKAQKDSQDVKDKYVNIRERNITTLNEKKVQFSKALNEFKSNQNPPNLMVDRQTEILKRKLDAQDKLRKLKRLKALENLDYMTEMPNYGDPDTWKSIINYDSEQLKVREHYRRLKNCWAKGKDENGNDLAEGIVTEETLVDIINDLTKQETELYIINTNGLYLGAKIKTQEMLQIRDEDGTLVTIDEAARSIFENHSNLFVYTDSYQKELMANFIKYLVLQLLTKYHTESIEVNIINPKGSSVFQDLNISRDYKSTKPETFGKIIKGPKYVKSYNTKKECDDFVKDVIKQDAERLNENTEKYYDETVGIERNIKSFEELVKTRRRNAGQVPKYTINILVDEDLKSDWDRFTEESKTKGIINFHMVRRSEVGQLKEDDGKLGEVISLIARSFGQRFGSIIEVSDTETGSLPQLAVHYRDRREKNIFYYNPISDIDITKCEEFLIERAQKLPKGFTTTAEFVESLLGDYDNWWHEDIEKCLRLYMGYVNGDKTKPLPVILDEEQKPHMFAAGTTGGGKSNMLAVLVNTLKACYNPEDLEVVYFDFKIAEVAMHASPYKMPHCSAMCGTSSPEYLETLLQYIDDEMMRRYAEMADRGVTKLSNLRKLYFKEMAEIQEQIKNTNDPEEKAKLEEKYWDVRNRKPPRMLVLVDEAAQAFQSEDTEFVMLVKSRFVKLGQLARAAGIHMLLVSQDCDKMPTALMDLIKVRGCTVAPPAISKNAIGNRFCAEPQNQFVGFFGVNDNNGLEESNIQYVVPFNPEEDTYFFTKMVNSMLDKRGYKSRDAVIFDENKDYKKAMFQQYIDNHPEEITGRDFFLGEGVYFQQEFKPLKLSIDLEQKNALAIISSSRKEREDILRIIYDQLKDKAVFFPIYCKSFIDSFPIEELKANTRKVFEKYCPNAKSRHNYFCAGVGKDMVPFMELTEHYDTACNIGSLYEYYPIDAESAGDPPDDYEIWGGRMTEEERNKIPYREKKKIEQTIQLREEMKEKIKKNEITMIGVMYLVRSLVKNKRDAYAKCMKIIKEGGDPGPLPEIYPPIYFVIFDLDKTNSYARRFTDDLARFVGDLAAVDIHCIFLSDKIDYYFDQAGYTIGSKIKGMQYPPKPFKNLNDKFAKLYEARKGKGVEFKVPR